jgi:hypothetical protein
MRLASSGGNWAEGVRLITGWVPKPCVNQATHGDNWRTTRR